MGDPVTGLAAASAISSVLQIVDFGGKVLYHATRLMASDDALRENIEIEQLALQQERLTKAVAGSTVWNARISAPGADLTRRAVEMNQKAGELLRMLDDLKICKSQKGLMRAFQSIRQAARALLKRSEMEKKQQELQELRGQLAIVMLQHIAEGQDGLRTAVNQQTGQIEETIKVLSEANKTIEERKQMEQRIIGSLHFDDLDSRQDTIIGAYNGTYTWSLNESNTKLGTWLVEGSGLFWICSKPGSGKSTFMKYIFHNPQTALLLNSSASKGQRWLVVDFFFWYVGSYKQKSIHGLLQAIIHKILLECPELISLVCPDQASGRQHGSMVWTKQQLLAAARIIAQTSCRSRLGGDEGTEELDVKFFLLIDGLDECDGNHAELVSVLQELAAPGRIKVCVSCRPWNVFINAMGNTDLVIRMEDYTHNDIEHYIRAKLTKAEESQRDRCSFFRKHEPQAENLMQAVVEKANGVFLWVFLVVRSLVAGFEEGDNLAVMQQRVDELPGDLIPYFRLILDRMSKTYRENAAIIIALVAAANRQGGRRHRFLSFLDVWPLVDSPNYCANPDFALRLPVKPCSRELAYEMLQKSVQLIRATCRDFVHIPDSRARELETWETFKMFCVQVMFIHRTVDDFFKLEDNRKVLIDFCPAHIFETSIASRIELARAKYVPLYSVGNGFRPCWHLHVLASLICHDHDSDTQVFQELDNLEVQYISTYCHAVCVVHEMQHRNRGLERHRRMWEMGFRKANMHAFVKRLRNFRKFGADIMSETLTGSNPTIGESQIIRYAFGRDCETTLSNEAAIPLDQLDIEQVSLFLAEAVSPDEVFVAFEAHFDREPILPIAKFLHRWLFTKVEESVDDAVWLVVKMLIEHGARVPSVCQIPTSEHCRTMLNEPLHETCHLETTRQSWWELPTETAGIKEALTLAVPKARVHEIDEVLAHVELV